MEVSQCCIRLAENDFMHIHPSEKNKILCFGKNREQREKRKLTQEKLGELTELSTVTISAIERGVKAPSFESLCALIKVLNLDARRIFPYDPGNL